MPRKTRPVVSFEFEIVSPTGDDVTSNAKSTYRCIDGIVVESSISRISSGDDHQIEIAVGAMTSFCAASKQPNLFRIQIMS